MTKKVHYDKEQRQIWRESLLPIPDDPFNKVEVRVHERVYIYCFEFLLIV